MWSHVLAPLRQRKGALDVLFQRYGFGRPDLGRDSQSASSAITQIAQDTIRPYENKASSRRLNEMKLFVLP
jgi:hypothetical protein